MQCGVVGTFPCEPTYGRTCLVVHGSRPYSAFSMRAPKSLMISLSHDRHAVLSTRKQPRQFVAEELGDTRHCHSLGNRFMAMAQPLLCSMSLLEYWNCEFAQFCGTIFVKHTRVGFCRNRSPRYLFVTNINRG